MTEKEEKLKAMTGREFYDVFGRKLRNNEITVKQYNWLYGKWKELKGINEGQQTDNEEKKSDEMVATIDYADKVFQGKEKKKSQTERLYELLLPGFPVRTDVIQEEVYGGDHKGVARIGARISDIKEKYGVNIKSWPDKEIKTLWYYKMTK